MSKLLAVVVFCLGFGSLGLSSASAEDATWWVVEIKSTDGFSRYYATTDYVSTDTFNGGPSLVQFGESYESGWLYVPATMVVDIYPKLLPQGQTPKGMIVRNPVAANGRQKWSLVDVLEPYGKSGRLLRSAATRRHVSGSRTEHRPYQVKFDDNAGGWFYAPATMLLDVSYRYLPPGEQPSDRQIR